MPLVVARGQFDADAFNCIRHDNGRLVFAGVRRVNRFAKVNDVVAVTGDCVKAERDEFVRQGFQLHNVFGVAVNHAVVAVNNRDAVGKVILTNGH